jgi:Vitamin K-dependent gamma-carboxylase
MAVSPALIVDAARLVAARHRREGTAVEVRADAPVSFNGRRSARVIDPTVDLAADFVPTSVVVEPDE